MKVQSIRFLTAVILMKWFRTLIVFVSHFLLRTGDQTLGETLGARSFKIPVFAHGTSNGALMICWGPCWQVSIVECEWRAGKL